MASRKLEDLTPELHFKALAHQIKCKESGIDILFTCTARSFQEQMALYAQGRQDIIEVNKLRLYAGLIPLLPQENHKKVTWTMASKHIINLEDNTSTNDKSKAYDIVVVKNGKAIWDIKADIDKDLIPDYEECGIIGERLGLVWGSRWSTPDYPHFQLG